MTMRCQCCGNGKVGRSRCKKRYCPECQGLLAAERKRELAPLVRKFKWPLFVTLTCANTATPEGLRHVQKAFCKLRRKKIWTAHVVGGIAAYEITDRGNGYHPHVHMVIDCEWLAFKTPRPLRGMAPNKVKALCKAAHVELSEEWAKCLKQPGNAIVWVTRCNAATILDEVCKYAVKGSDLVEVAGSAGDVIDAINKCRLMSTWGTAYKRGEPQERHPLACEACGEVGCILPDAVATAMALRSAAKHKGKRR